MRDPYTFERLLVDRHNEAAVRIAHSVCDGTNPHQLIAIHSSEQHGKSHLLHAIGKAWCDRGYNSPIDAHTAEYFANALRGADHEAWDRYYRSKKALLVDDVDLLPSNHPGAPLLWALCREFLDQNRAVVVTSRPAFLATDLLAVLGVSHVSAQDAEIGRPSIEFLVKLAHATASQRGTHLTDEEAIGIADESDGYLGRVIGLTIRRSRSVATN